MPREYLGPDPVTGEDRWSEPACVHERGISDCPICSPPVEESAASNSEPVAAPDEPAPADRSAKPARGRRGKEK